MRALRERVRALEQQLASTADEAPDPGKGPSDVHRSRVLGWLPPANDGNAQDELEPAMPHALMLALRGLDDAGLRREFNKHADKDKDTERRMSKAGLASFMRDKGLAHGDADVERAMERVDTNKDGDIDYAEFRSLSQADSDLEKVLQAKHLEGILCYYFPKGTTLQDLAKMERAQFSAIVKKSEQTMVQLLVDVAAQVAAVGTAQDGAGGSKFSGELKGGTLDDFYEGVTGVCGEPDADVEKGESSKMPQPPVFPTPFCATSSPPLNPEP